MRLEEIIKLGQIEYDTSIFSFNYWIWWTIIIVFVILFIVSIVKDWDGIGFHATVFLITFLLLCLVNFLSDSFHKDELIDTWKEEYALPYISSLPIEQREIIYIKIDPEIKTTTSGSLLYINSTHKELTPITVSYKSNGEIYTVTNWVSTKMNLSDDEKPYVEYRYLDQKLGNGVNEGTYDLTIHLPESYTFTDIK